jgi:hypothetical protein
MADSAKEVAGSSIYARKVGEATFDVFEFC